MQRKRKLTQVLATAKAAVTDSPEAVPFQAASDAAGEPGWTADTHSA
jgi:hypothetical protein